MRTTRQLIQLAAALSCGALLLTACASTAGAAVKPTATPKVQTYHSKSHHSKKLTIALVNGDNSDPYFYSVWKGAIIEAKKYGVNLEEVAPPTFDYTEQTPLVADMLAKHVNGLILSADATGTTFNAYLATAKKEHIPVLIVNESESDMDNNPNSLAFITSSNTRLAQLAAQQVAALIHGTGQVGIINTSVTVVSLLHRETGFANYLKAHYKKITVLPEDVAGDSVSTSDSDATDLIEAHPGIKAIYAVDDFNAEGAAIAIRALHKRGIVKLVAIDAEPIEVKYLKSGYIQALIAQQPLPIGELAVTDIMEALAGRSWEVKRNVSPPGIVLTRRNVNDPAFKDVPYDPTLP